MVKIGDVVCPRCGEDRETLVTPVEDPMGKRWFCSVCAHEFRAGAQHAPARARVSQ